MAQRQWRLVLIFLGVCVVFAPPVEAQRSGFIIGLGLGYGVASYPSAQDRESLPGLALDFHIGGVIGDSFELYYVHKGTLLRTDEVGVDFIGSGMSGLGFSYPLNPKFSINGGIGMALWSRIYAGGGTTDEAEGLGLVAGVRYKLSESGRWALGFDFTYGEPFPDFKVQGVQLTINVLSH